MSKEKTFKGYNGNMILTDKAVIIKRGFKGFLLGGGKLRGDKTIPYNSIVAVQLKKGIQYYNSRCKKGCENTFKNFNFNYIVDALGEKISNLYFTDEEILEIDKRAGTEIALLEEKRNKELTQIERKKKKLREDLSYLRSNKLTLLKSKVYSPERIHQ